MSLSNFANKINALLQDDARIMSDPERRIFLAQALKIYSKYRPLDAVADIAGDGTYTYALPSTFLDGFSQIKNIEYPQGDQVPSMLATDEVALYRGPASLDLRFLNILPAAGKTIRLAYSALHTVTVTTSSVPPSDEDAVASLAASIGCQALAAHYAQTTDPTLIADTVDYRSKSSEYNTLATRLKAIFNNFLGLKEGDTLKAATGTGDWDTNYQWGGDRILHPRNTR